MSCQLETLSPQMAGLTRAIDITVFVPPSKLAKTATPAPTDTSKAWQSGGGDITRKSNEAFGPKYVGVRKSSGKLNLATNTDGDNG